MERTNKEWLRDLRAKGPQQADAINDLLAHLERGVLAYLRSRSDLRYLAQSELQQMSQDFAQDALLKVQKHLDTFKGKSKLTTWASKIAANHTISELRRARWRDVSLDAMTEAGTSLQEILSVPTSPGNEPDTANERRQVWNAILDVIENDLTDRQRQALVSTKVDNIPIAEVAHLMDTNANNIYKILHDARLKLKRSLQALDLESDYIMKLFS